MARSPKRLAEAKSRPAVIALCVLTLRLMDNWRSVLAQIYGGRTDTDCAMIVMAVVAIGAEKFIRGALEAPLYSLASPMPPGRLSKCNHSSIAAATGIHRETVRRKVLRLSSLGILEINEVDGIRVTAAFAKQRAVLDIVQPQIDAVTRANRRLSDFSIET